jgi:hypothetical protein
MSAVAYSQHTLQGRVCLLPPTTSPHPQTPPLNALKHTCCPPILLTNVTQSWSYDALLLPARHLVVVKSPSTFTLVFSAKQAKRLKWNTLSQGVPLGKEHISSSLLPTPFLAQVSSVTQDFFSAKMVNHWGSNEAR